MNVCITNLSILFLLFTLLWNVLTVGYFVWQARWGTLTARKLTLVFTLGFGFLVAGILLFVLARADGVNLRTVGFSAVVFLIQLLAGIPIYFIAKHVLVSRLNRWGMKARARKD